MFDVVATAYVAARGRAALEIEVAYEVLLSNGLILQPTLELATRTRTDHDGTGSGRGRAEASLRVRNEVPRRSAPYMGIVHEEFGGTSMGGGAGSEARITLGCTDVPRITRSSGTP